MYNFEVGHLRQTEILCKITSRAFKNEGEEEMMPLEADISDIQEKLKNNGYPNEQSILQGIVLRLLSTLGWPVYDTQLVCPEYNIQGRRVDLALFVRANKPVIFLEAKQLGKIDGADKQLFEYAFHAGVPFAIATDGKEWHFYLPAETGNYDERRVYKLDLIERDIQESAYRFERYLAFNSVTNDSALENAKKDYKNISKEREAKANIPIAWGKLLEEKDEMLLDVISEKVESICGFKPPQKQISNYLKSLQQTIATTVRAEPTATVSTTEPSRVKPHPISASTKSSERAKIKVTFPGGEEIYYSKVAETMVEVIRKIGFEKVKSLNIQMYDCPLVSEKQHRQNKYNWSDAGGMYIFTHSNTDKKISQLNEINDSLSLGLKIEKI